VPTELRAAVVTVGDVLVVPAVLRLGPETAAGENLYELWLNPWASALPVLMALAMVETIVVRLYGDGAAEERTLAFPNRGRPFFVEACTRAASLPPWSMAAFDAARRAVEERHDSVLALWRALGKQQSGQ